MRYAFAMKKTMIINMSEPSKPNGELKTTLHIYPKLIKYDNKNFDHKTRVHPISLFLLLLLFFFFFAATES